MESKSSVLLAKLRKAFQEVGDPVRAPVMQAYMKSAMPYHGVPTPLLRQVCKAVFLDVEFATGALWRLQVLDLWRNARFREERYAALYLAGDRRAVPFQTPSAMKMYEELIVTGAWWDYVDDLASHRVGPILKAYPAPMRRKMLAWSKPTTCGSGVPRSYANSDSSKKRIWNCCMPALNLRWDRGNSSFRRQ